ncbi:MAG: multifunctional CCA addition/repair protein [Pseudomonadota bacterium]|nr:multifunctional CCA addition/repair protein [Pseudomonadota bacterium]
MKIYLVGGAIRNKLLKLPVKERDWVVVGSEAKELEKNGFKKVGKSFPVFLHPKTKEEYALARTEKKSGTGYHGFDVYSGKDVTLEEDLKRRDLTINAIAEDKFGKLIDPFNGQNDLKERILRHVSPAFSDDPLRVLRIARFAAEFHEQGFKVAEITESLLKGMSKGGELNALTPERVWRETEKALMSSRPDIYFHKLHEWGALKYVFPEIEMLFGVPQPKQWHPEIDTGIHVLMALKVAAELSESTEVRFATLVHDLGKAKTPQEQWPGHRGHEKRSLEIIDELCDRLNLPNRYRNLGKIVAEFHTHVHRAKELKPETILKILNQIDAFRRPDRFTLFLLSCEADARGRKGLENNIYSQGKIFSNVFNIAAKVDSSQFKGKKLEGVEFGKAIDNARLDLIKAAIKEIQS